MNWTEAFSRGSGEVCDLTPDAFAKALRALDAEYEGLSRGDPRYQAACATGELHWYDEQGLRVTIRRHGSVDSPFAVDGKVKYAAGEEPPPEIVPPKGEPPPEPMPHSIMAGAPAVEIPALGVTLNPPTRSKKGKK